MLDLALRLDLELRTAVTLAEAAGDAVLAAKQGEVDVVRKADSSPVTEADHASDAVLREGLLEAFPADGYISEEHVDDIAGTSGRTWIIDPLDGTEAFVAGTEDFVVQVALVEGAQALLGVVYEPSTRRMYHAIKGVGAFLSVGGGGTIRQLRVSKMTSLADMALLTTSSMPEARFQALLDATGAQNGGRVRSVGFKIGKLVRREADVYYSAHPVHVWDSAAPAVVLEAAGGKMTHLDGSPLVYDVAGGFRTHGAALVASNGHIHDQVLQAIASADA